MKKNKDNDTTMKDKKRDTGRTKEKFPVKTKQEETSKLNGDEGIGGAKIVYATEPTFSVLMVYAYGDFQSYRELSERLFRNPRPSEFTANGFAAFGCGVEEIGQSVFLIWVNNDQPLENTLPVFVHEIVHLSQDILDHAGVTGPKFWKGFGTQRPRKQKGLKVKGRMGSPHPPFSFPKHPWKMRGMLAD